MRISDWSSDVCSSDLAAAEITLQPLRRFGFDGSILFSDILIVPYALGQDLWFEAGGGPRLAPPLQEADLAALMLRKEKLEPIYETVRLVKAGLPAETSFLGFAGSTWTVATSMVAGQGAKDHGLARRMAYAALARSEEHTSELQSQIRNTSAPS